MKRPTGLEESQDEVARYALYLEDQIMQRDCQPDYERGYVAGGDAALAHVLNRLKNGWGHGEYATDSPMAEIRQRVEVLAVHASRIDSSTEEAAYRRGVAAGVGSVVNIPLTVRLRKAVLDEVVGNGYFHLEQMSASHWWMALGGVHVHLVSDTTIRGTWEEEGSLVSVEEQEP